ncbi:unnamed protein product, partial [Vitis vinifera]
MLESKCFSVQKYIMQTFTVFFHHSTLSLISSLLLLRFFFWTLSGCHRVSFGNTHERKQYPESCKLINIKVDSPLHACISSEPWKIASPLLMKPGEAETFTTGRY